MEHTLQVLFGNGWVLGPIVKNWSLLLALDQIKSRRMSMASVRIIMAVVCETVSTLKFVFYFS